MEITEQNLPKSGIINKSISEDYYNADMHIKMAHVVTNRTYWAFSVMIVVIVMTVVVLFNHYYSYEEQMYKKMNILLRVNNLDTQGSLKIANDTLTMKSDSMIVETIIFSEITRDSLIKRLNAGTILPIDSLGRIEEKNQNPISQAIRENYIRNHIESAYISIPLLGIKFGVNDILVLMSIAFLVLSIWLYLCIRSENFTIGKILSLSQTKSIDIRRYIFYGICFNNMFFPTTQRSKPYNALSNISKSLSEELNEIPVKMKKRPRWTRILLSYVFFIPFIIMALNIAIHRWDILNILGKDEYTTIKYKNREYYTNDSKTARLDFKDENIKTGGDDPYKKYLDIVFWFSAALIVLIGYCCHKTWVYQNGTNKVLYRFKQRFKHDDDCLKNIDRYQLRHKPANIQVVSVDSKIFFFYNNKLINKIFSLTYKFKKMKDEFARQKDEFAREYSIEKGFYLLTHSGDDNEVERLKDNLSTLNYKNNPDIHFGFGTYYKEYFIFLKTNESKVDAQ
ncbi:MAG: hypothetical protein LBQ28_06220 [Prevotellaceae bacterium]|jgi:hypothetical protein|nr:hypothetical protein [Prevotellaceae bacterium]